jgi:hypothetical protein
MSCRILRTGATLYLRKSSNSEEATTKLQKPITNCSMLMVSSFPTSCDRYQLLTCAVLVTGQLADDLQEVIREIETLFGTLDEESLKLQ